MKRLLPLLVLALTLGVNKVHADPLQWSVPYFGTVNMPFQSTQLLAGYDPILHEAVSGVSTPVGLLWNEIIPQVGAVGVLGSSTHVQPYLGVGVDIGKHLPGMSLSLITDLDLSAAMHYDTGAGKVGMVLGASYSF